MLRSVALMLFFATVLLPTAVVASFFSLLGAAFVWAGLSGDPSIPLSQAVPVALVLAAGWFGISTLFRLYIHFRACSACPKHPRRAAAGLVVGTATSVVLAVGSGGSLAFSVVFFGWPVIGAVVLGLMLANSWLRPNNSSKPTPLRDAA